MTQHVDSIIKRFEFKYCDYGSGVNADWPEEYHCPTCKGNPQTIMQGPDQADPFIQIIYGECKRHEPTTTWKCFRSK